MAGRWMGALLGLGALASSALAHAATTCEVVAGGSLPKGVTLESVLAQAYSTDDGMCLARVALQKMKTQPRWALVVADRAVQVAPSQPLTYLARGLAGAALLAHETAALGHGSPQTCEGLRLRGIVDDLSVGALAKEEPNAPAVIQTTLARLAAQCADGGPMAALASALQIAYPQVPAPALETLRADKIAGGLSGAIVRRRVVGELTGQPDAAPAETRRRQFRWLIEESYRKDKKFMKSLEGQEVARALMAVDMQIQGSSAHAGLVLEDLSLVARVGGLHYLPVMDPVGDWMPWLAGARLGSIERAALRELEAVAGEHDRSPPIALFAFKVRLVLAMQERDDCEKGRGIVAAMSRFAGPSQELPVERYQVLAREAAKAGQRAAQACPRGAFVVGRELASVADRLQAGAAAVTPTGQAPAPAPPQPRAKPRRTAKR